MKVCLLALVGVFAIMTTTTANAVEVTSLYTAQVPLDQTRGDPRVRAYETALAQVILRVSGADLLNDRDLYDELFPDPAELMVQFRPGPEETLFVSFDGEAIEATLTGAGQTVWGSDRPLTLVWLAVDWGQGKREIVAATDSDRDRDDSRSIDRNGLLRERILDFAERRGLPVVFPLLDSEDRENLTFSDIWGGFDERVLAASKRYDVNSVLIGRVRAASGSRNRWVYHFSGQQRNWSGEPEYAITQISDLLAAEFAIRGDAPLRAVELNISGVTSVQAFGEVQKMLAGINIVKSYSITEVIGDRIRFAVNAHGGAERLARALRFEGLLEEDRIDTGEFGDFGFNEPATSLDFYFSP